MAFCEKTVNLHGNTLQSVYPAAERRSHPVETGPVGLLETWSRSERWAHASCRNSKATKAAIRSSSQKFQKPERHEQVRVPAFYASSPHLHTQRKIKNRSKHRILILRQDRHQSYVRMAADPSRRRPEYHPAVNDVLLTLTNARGTLADVQRRLDLEFRAAYPDHVSILVALIPNRSFRR
jgi:hypothetical protein